MAVVRPGRGLVVVWLLAGCGGQALAPPRQLPGTDLPPTPPPPTPATGGDPRASDGADAATGTIAPAPRVRTSPLTGADLSKAEVLAADDDGIYWITSDNQLWMLPAWSDTPRVLAASPNPTAGITAGATLLVRGNDILWTANVVRPSSALPGRPLHRTLKTGGDVVVVEDLGDPPELAADQATLYFPSDGSLAALPLDANPGAAPTLLAPLGNDMEVSALAVDDQNLYWLAYPKGQTAYAGSGGIYFGVKASLLAGTQTSTGELSAGDYTFLTASGGSLYYVFRPTLAMSGVARVDGNHAATYLLSIPAGTSIVAFDGWVVTSTAQVPSTAGKIYAASADAVAGGGQVAVEIADDVMVPPVAGLPGLVFVDGGGHLLAVSAQDLGTAIAAGQR